ncbi:MAG: nitroreductase family protein, partial [Brevinematales bacterium]
DCQLQGKDYAFFDTGMAVGSMLLAATELDLILHPIAGFDTNLAKQILRIPDDMILITLLIGGKKSDAISGELSPHQREAELSRPPRKALKEFVFVETWGNSFHSIS